MQLNSPTSQGTIAPDYSSHHEPRHTRERELRSPPPPYTSTTDQPTPAKRSNLFSKSLTQTNDLSSISREDGHNNEHPRPVPTSLAGEVYSSEPPMSATTGDPWSKYDDTPGCCCSSTGGCCFSSRGGCCFSDTEGCCFSSRKGCCFSSDSACCFSNHDGSIFSSGKVRLLSTDMAWRQVLTHFCYRPAAK